MHFRPMGTLYLSEQMAVVYMCGIEQPHADGGPGIVCGSAGWPEYHGALPGDLWTTESAFRMMLGRLAAAGYGGDCIVEATSIVVISSDGLNPMHF